MNVDCKKTFKISPELLRPSDNMVEISPGCGFYLRKCKYSIIQLNFERDQDWRQMVREVLLDVYGNSLSNYSATGKKSKRLVSIISFLKDYMVSRNSFLEL
ncbi:hypothetical protein PV328_007689 [Microctonus aethiopoides]|uniref:Uncharacterized protein n=1 Tax=Microctonus aethiopoides TaxID=144406 RepID=A0AA39F0S8_9HYME|nr:hypothetical protein PV328_007689 [Microctonus aethiopoides]